MTRASVSGVGLPSGLKALYIASRLIPASRAISVIPRARVTSPRAAAISAGSPSSKAASRYSLTSSAVFRCSVGSQGSVSRAISVFLCQFFGAPDVTALRAVIATAEQHDSLRPAVYQIDAVSGSIIDPQLRNAGPNGTHVAGVAEGQATDPDVDPSDGGAVAEARRSGPASVSPCPIPAASVRSRCVID